MGIETITKNRVDYERVRFEEPQWGLKQENPKDEKDFIEFEEPQWGLKLIC